MHSPPDPDERSSLAPPGPRPTDDRAVHRPPGHARKRPSRWLLEAAVIVVVALGVAVLLRTFVVQTFYIPSASMEPTLKVGDRIVVDKLAYDFHSVHRGDIVVFSRPPLEARACAGPLVDDLVKRVVALPGETISLHDGSVEVNGRTLSEPWLPAGTLTAPGPGSAPYSLHHPYTVPAGMYFVMGDNRTYSCDSRYWGPVPGSLIVGKVDLRIWPLSRLAIF